MGLVDKHLQAIGGRKMAMPILTAQSLWNKTGEQAAMNFFFFKFNPATGNSAIWQSGIL